MKILKDLSTIYLFLLILSLNFAVSQNKSMKVLIENREGYTDANQVDENRMNSIFSNLNMFLKKTGYIRKSIQSNSIQGKSPFPLLKTALPDFKSILNKKNNIIWDNEFGTPRLIEVNLPSPAKAANALNSNNAIQIAYKYLEENKELLKIQNSHDEFKPVNCIRDEIGITHIRMQQNYNGIDVWSKEIYMHIDDFGRILSLNGRYTPTPQLEKSDKGEISESIAIQKAVDDITKKNKIVDLPLFLKNLHNYSGPTAKKFIWFDNLLIPHLVFVVEVRNGLSQEWFYFIDAKNGTILNSYNNSKYDGPVSGSGIDLNGINRTFGVYQSGNTYYMIDASQPMFKSEQSQIPQNAVGGIVCLDLKNTDLSQSSTIYFVGSNNNQWTDKAAISTHYNAITGYNYYRTTHNRNSIDDKGMTIYSIVHVTESGQPMDNAFWSGSVMCFGDGYQYFKPWSGALDLSVHELTHGVTQYSANLEYQYQSGALNESMSDVFGAMAERKNWKLGEDIVKSYESFPSGALRDLENPHNGGASANNLCWQPMKMSEYVNTESDNGGVHVNSGIPNHAFYLVSKSIGNDKTEKIWYRALTVYLTKSSQFIDARIATVKAATDLYGASGAEVNAVKNAWDAVEVFDGSGTPPTVITVPQGDEWILLTATLSGDPYSLYMVKTKVQSLQDFYPLISTKVSNRPAVSDDGKIIIFVDGNHNLRILYANPQNPQEQILDNQGVWSSVAIGPNLSSIALTTTLNDTSIYVFDFVNSKSYKFKISPQSYDGGVINTAKYADAMSFDPTGKYLLFDAYNEIQNSYGGNLSYWTINLLDVQTGKMANVFPPIGKGLNVGNPSFSKTSTTRFTFDYWSDQLHVNNVMSADFNAPGGLAIGVIATNIPVIGYPTYSGNDQVIAYHTKVYNTQMQLVDGVIKMPLQSDCLNGTGVPEPHSSGSTYPVWFVVTTKRVDVEENKNTYPEVSTLLQNYPNPFNPATTISFELVKKDFVTIEIYNSLGQKIRSLINKSEYPAGSWNVIWDGKDYNGLSVPSGTYFCKLFTRDFIKTGKMIFLK